MTTNAGPRMDYTSRDFASLKKAMLDLAAERLPEWTDQSENDLGVLLVELMAYLGDALFYHQDRIASEGYLATASERRSVLNMLRLIGYELRGPVAATAGLTLYFQSSSGASNLAVRIPQGAQFGTPAAVTGQPLTFVYTGPTLNTIVSQPGTGPDGKSYLVYAGLPVVQVDNTIANEYVASSDGSAGQRYALAQTPLIDGTLSLWVKVSGTAPLPFDASGNPQPGWNPWTPQDTLLGSGPNDPSFVVRRDENNVAWIEFGDGTNGMIPPRGQNNVVVSYSVGGGAKGNVRAGVISTAITTISSLQIVTNAQPATGGAEAEPVDAAIARAPTQFRSMDRAVTASDYVAHALSFGVAKALATAPSWNRVQLVVAPAGGGYASDQLKADLRQYFEAKRMITSFVDIVDPTYVCVNIAFTVTLGPYYLKSQVQQSVDAAMQALWSFDNVEFGTTLYVSKLYEVIQLLDGVLAVNVTQFQRADHPSDPSLPANGLLAFGPAEIPLCDTYSATLVGGR